MFKVALAFFLFFTFNLFAEQKYEIYASCLDVDEDVISAKEGAVLLYNGKYIYAKEVAYDSLTQKATLKGEIFIIDSNQITIASDKAEIFLAEDKTIFVPFYFIDDDSKLWIKADQGSNVEHLYFADNAVTSSCDPDDPDWLVRFSSMKYDADSQMLDMFNPVLYIKDVPVFYLPYMRVSTNKERKSGFLRPIVGYGGDDGIFYEQPIYFAPSLWWDVELNPQIRLKRSKGIHATLRFVDSETSQGYIKAGYFENKESYRQKYDLERSSHAGVEIYYEDGNVFDSVDDGFYLEVKQISDIDYFGLTSKEPVSSSVTGDLVESKMNYFVRDEDYYLGTYLKYYDDTTKDSNKDTIQLLPRIQAHKFSNRLLIDNILYSADMTYSNYTRREGVKAQQFELSLPITFYTQAFNDYLHLSLSENFYMTRVNFTGGYDSYEYYRSVHHLNLFTDLIKPYKHHYHNLNFGMGYTHPGYEREDIRYDDLSNVQKEFFKITTPRKGYNLYLKQYLYDFNEREIFYHRLNQPYSYDSRGKRITGEMENTFRYRVNNEVSLGLSTYYSHQQSDFSRILSSVNIRKSLYDMNLRHLYSNDFNGNRNSYFTAGAGYNFFQYRLFMNLDYDYANRFTKRKVVGFNMNKNCWDYSVTLSEDVTPTLTSGNKNSKKEKRIMFEINLVPFGGFAQAIR